MYRKSLPYSLIAHADVLSGTRGLKFSVSLHLHPSFVHASSKDCIDV